MENFVGGDTTCRTCADCAESFGEAVTLSRNTGRQFGAPVSIGVIRRTRQEIPLNYITRRAAASAAPASAAVASTGQTNGSPVAAASQTSGAAVQAFIATTAPAVSPGAESIPVPAPRTPRPRKTNAIKVRLAGSTKDISIKFADKDSLRDALQRAAELLG